MADQFEIRTVRQLRAINAPARRAIFEALLSGPLTAGEIAARCAQSPEGAHYHLRQLIGIGLATIVEERETGARPEKVFALTHRHLELKKGPRGPAFRKELIRGVRLILRLAEREYERATGLDESHLRPRVSRVVGWLSGEDVKRVERLEAQLEAVFRQANEQAQRNGTRGRERLALTAVLSPIEPSSDSP